MPNWPLLEARTVCRNPVTLGTSRPPVPTMNCAGPSGSAFPETPTGANLAYRWAWPFKTTSALAWYASLQNGATDALSNAAVVAKRGRCQ